MKKIIIGKTIEQQLCKQQSVPYATESVLYETNIELVS